MNLMIRLMFLSFYLPHAGCTYPRKTDRLFVHLRLQSTSGLYGVGQFLTHTQARFTPLQDGFTAKLFKARQ